MGNRHRKFRVVFLAVVILLIAGFFIGRRVIPRTQSGPATEPLRASGVIQAQQISIASEFGGLIDEIPVEEGAFVAAGNLVAQLDTGLIDGQIAVAEALVTTAEMGLAQARAGARPGKVAVAEAQAHQAQAALTAAQRAVTDTLLLIDSPQDIDLQIAVLRAQIASAYEQHAQAVALKDAVEVAKERFEKAYTEFDGGGRTRFEVAEGTLEDLIRDTLPDELSEKLPVDFGDNLPGTGEYTIEVRDYELHLDNGNYQLYAWKNIVFPMEATLLPNQWWQAWVGVNAATARKEGLEAQLKQLIALRANPQDMHTQLDEMTALESQLEAQMMMAEVQVDALQAGLTPEELTAIEAKVNQARTGLQALMTQRDMMVLTTPISGTVVDILLREGEVAAQGAAIIAVADLADLTLTVYVPETRLGDIWVDQIVDVRIDSFPQRTFHGTVRAISDNAEFTPRNVTTVEERQNLVFAVSIRINNENGVLKPGMPADVVFTTNSGTR